MPAKLGIELTNNSKDYPHKFLMFHIRTININSSGSQVKFRLPTIYRSNQSDQVSSN
jgi:hypothetical protein